MGLPKHFMSHGKTLQTQHFLKETDTSALLVLKDGKVTMEPRGPIVGRIVSEDNLLQISKTDFKKYLAERQISSREFEFEMRDKGLLVDDKKGRLTTGWKSARSGPFSSSMSGIRWRDTGG